MPQAFTPQQMAIIKQQLFNSACRYAITQGIKKTSLEQLTADAGISKSTFYKFYDCKEQLFLEEALAFGDSENDMAMLKEAGLSFCMHTAKDHVKKCADRECKMVSRVLEDLIAGRL